MLFHPKEHRFAVGDEVKLRVCDSEYWDVVILKRTRLLWWLPSYVVAMADPEPGDVIIPGVLDCALRKV